jgi:hypothetical protein
MVESLKSVSLLTLMLADRKVQYGVFHKGMKSNSADADLKDWVAFFPLVDLGKDEPHTLCPLFNRNEVEQILPLCRVIGLVNMYEIRPREYLLNRFVKQKKPGFTSNVSVVGQKFE